MNQAQTEAHRHATRRNKYVGRRAWTSARRTAVGMLGQGRVEEAIGVVMAGHDAEVFHTLAVGRLRTGRAVS